jgi:imidazolonepropionase-like amidohydrolase
MGKFKGRDVAVRRLIVVILLPFLIVASPTRADFAITNVTVLDGTGAPPLRNATVVVRENRIASVLSGGRVPTGLRRIDGSGKFLIPGLMDVHVHIVGTGQWRGLENPQGVTMDFAVAEAALRGYLYFGVTSVYDAGNVPGFIYDLRKRERAGTLTSPRIFATGPAISYPGSWMAGDWHGLGAPDWPDTIKFLDRLLADKPDMQKLVMDRAGPSAPTLRPELAAKIIGYMKERGIHTTVHAVIEELAQGAIDAGIDSLAHPIATAPATPAFTQALARRKIPVATTLSVYDEIVRLGEDPSYLDGPMYRAVFSPEEIAARKAEGPKRYASLGWTSLFKARMPMLFDNVRNLHEAGGILALATDRSEGPLIHRELELLLAAGVPTKDLLRIATYNGAIFLGKEKDLGSVAPGKLADLLLLEADPTVDVANYQRIAAVIKDGVEVDRTKLDLPVNRH